MNKRDRQSSNRTDKRIHEIPKEIHILYANCRSLSNKIDDLKVWISQRAKSQSPSPTIITLVETWLNDKTSNEEMSLPGYEIVSRKDRKDTTCCFIMRSDRPTK